MASRYNLQASAVFAVVAVVLVSSAFAFVGFAAAEHRADVEQQVTTASTNHASMSVPADLRLYVVGPDPIRGHVEAAFVAAFAERGVAALVVTDLAPEYDQPVLLVGIRDSDLAYNPVPPSASATLTVEYAADGNVTQFGQSAGVSASDFDSDQVRDHLLSGDSIPITLDDDNTLFRRVDIRLTDATTGVISWPGYREYIVDALAESSITHLLADAA